MNLDDAIQKHAEWKVKFRTAMARKEKLDAATIGKDNCCPLGQWLHGEGRLKLGARPEFRSAFDKHKAFHVEAGKVAQLINEQQYNRAEQALGAVTPYGMASQAVGSALMALKKMSA